RRTSVPHLLCPPPPPRFPYTPLFRSPPRPHHPRRRAAPRPPRPPRPRSPPRAGGRRIMTTHGTRACYLRGCDHPECARAARRYCKEYRMRILADPTCTGVPTGPAAEHTARLHARGMSYAAIAAAAGVSESTVKRLAQQRKTSRTTAAAILAVTVDSPVDTHWVDRKSTR